MPSIRSNWTPIRVIITILSVIFITIFGLMSALTMYFMYYDFSNLSKPLIVPLFLLIMHFATSITAIVGYGRNKYDKPILLYALILAIIDCFVYVSYMIFYALLNNWDFLFVLFIVYTILLYFGHKQRSKVQEKKLNLKLL